MQNQLVPILVIAVVIAIGVGVAVWFYMQRRRRTENLKERFGPEYDRAVGKTDDRHRGEAELEKRERRVEQLAIRPLSAPERDAFAERWRSAQAQFVDDPAGAIKGADRLVGELMQARGYPVGDFEQGAADVSVDHPGVVEHYRAAHAIALRTDRGDADTGDTEDLRQAFVHYRALFDDLLEVEAPAPGEERR
jgi:hypothetical protein